MPVAPFRYLFVDMNSFFASVEQQAQPALRGRPIGVVPVKTDATCCIASSYEARAFGVRTGTAVAEARRLCPQVRLVLARPRLYVQCHQRIIKAVESCLHVEQICSIDEVYGRLMRNEQSPRRAVEIGRSIKRAIRDAVGPYVRCSIGIGPNIWLAKVATDLEKPDGLVLLSPDELPERLAGFELTDLPGVARRMSVRLARHGVVTVDQLWALSERELRKVWGSRVLGSIWWSQMHGHALPPRPTQRRTVGHSHVLDPKMRTHQRAYQVMVRMIHKAARRMRRLGYCAGAMELAVRFDDGRRWARDIRLPHAYDTLTLVRHARRVWPARPIGTPKKVSTVLFHLTALRSATRPLFASQRQLNRLADVMDRIALRFGRDAVYSAAMFDARGSAPTRISFTQLPDDTEFDAADVGYIHDAPRGVLSGNVV